MKFPIAGAVLAAALLLAPLAHADTGVLPIGDAATATPQLWASIVASFESIAQDAASVAGQITAAVQTFASVVTATHPGSNQDITYTSNQLPSALAQTASVGAATLSETATTTESEQSISPAPQQQPQSISPPSTASTETEIGFQSAPAANASTFVTQGEFDAGISALNDTLRQFIAANTFNADASPPLGGGASNTIAAASAIDYLSGVTRHRL